MEHKGFTFIEHAASIQAVSQGPVAAVHTSGLALPWLPMRCDDARHTGSAHGMLGIAWLWRCGPQLGLQLGGQYGLLFGAQKRRNPKSDELQISPARFGGMLRALAHRHRMSWDTK